MILTDFDTLAAAAAFFRSPKHCMLMKEEIHFANDLLWACFYAFPASFASMRIELNMPSLATTNVACF